MKLSDRTTGGGTTKIRVSRALVGSKCAYELNGEILVSPAMCSLMRSGTPMDDIVYLFKHIKVVGIDQASPFVKAMLEEDGIVVKTAGRNV